MRIRILVVDDEESICDQLQYNLEKAGYDVDCAYSAEEALGRNLAQYSLIISDIMMDRMSGFDFAREIKRNAETENVPLIFCSALTGEDETVMGLNIGADDYITKPYDINIVLARVNAVLRRNKGRHTPVAIPAANTHQHHAQAATPAAQTNRPGYLPDIVFKGIRIDQNEKCCYIDGNPIRLTEREYSLLHFFLTNRNHIFSRSEIIEHVWKGRSIGNRVVDTNITRLKPKIEPYNNFVTRPGFGYGFKDEL